MSISNTKFNLTISSYAERAQLASRIQDECDRSERGEKIDLRQTAEKLHSLTEALNKDSIAIGKKVGPDGKKLNPALYTAYQAHQKDLKGLATRVNALSSKANTVPSSVNPAIPAVGFAALLATSYYSGIFSSTTSSQPATEKPPTQKPPGGQPTTEKPSRQKPTTAETSGQRPTTEEPPPPQQTEHTQVSSPLNNLRFELHQDPLRKGNSSLPTSLWYRGTRQAREVNPAAPASPASDDWSVVEAFNSYAKRGISAWSSVDQLVTDAGKGLGDYLGDNFIGNSFKDYPRSGLVSSVISATSILRSLPTIPLAPIKAFASSMQEQKSKGQCDVRFATGIALQALVLEGIYVIGKAVLIPATVIGTKATLDIAGSILFPDPSFATGTIEIGTKTIVDIAGKNSIS